ncbi:hypothetical protein KI387_026540, partial [Taxus chinensis]
YKPHINRHTDKLNPKEDCKMSIIHGRPSVFSCKNGGVNVYHTYDFVVVILGTVI